MKLLNLTGNVENVKQLKNDFTTCGLAVTERQKNADGKYEDVTTWFNLYWRNSDYPKYNTGDLVTVIGSYKQNVYTAADGTHKIQTDIWPCYNKRIMAKKIEELDLPL